MSKTLRPNAHFSFSCSSYSLLHSTGHDVVKTDCVSDSHYRWIRQQIFSGLDLSFEGGALLNWPPLSPKVYDKSPSSECFNCLGTNQFKSRQIVTGTTEDKFTRCGWDITKQIKGVCLYTVYSRGWLSFDYSWAGEPSVTSATPKQGVLCYSMCIKLYFLSIGEQPPPPTPTLWTQARSSPGFPTVLWQWRCNSLLVAPSAWLSLLGIFASEWYNL